MNKEEIRREDCPPGKAPDYPGKKSKNNKNGTELSKSEFVDNVIEQWVRHFVDKERYENTPWAHKTTYLKRYLEPLNVARSDAQKKLIEIETRLASEAEENELTQSQNNLIGDMEVEMKESGKKENEASKWGRDQKIKKWMEFSDLELFEGGLEIPDDVMQSTRYKQREKMYYLSLTDNDLFERYKNISSYTRSSVEFKERHNQYVENFMDENFANASSQEILLKLPETPACIQNSESFKKRLCHLSFEERSQRLVLQNIKETVDELQKTTEGKKQAKIIIAGVSHPTFGDPGLNLSKTVKQEVRQAKGNLLTGKTSILKVSEKEKRQIYPKSVEAIAKDHWLETTIPEPAKHSGKAVEENGETLPTRYQDKTDKECYLDFKEECEGKVKIEMKKVAAKMKEKLALRPDTPDRKRRVDYAESLSDKFPGQAWYIKQRPKETKLLCNHTTGLCHLCEAAKENFTNIVNAVKRRCRCGSHSCPNFACACPIPDDDEEEAICSCPPCECELCRNCQVGYEFKIFVFQDLHLKTRFDDKKMHLFHNLEVTLV